MNHEQFETAMDYLGDEGQVSITQQLRARDTAQREALGRLERELDRERDRADMAEVELQHARAALATQPAAEQLWAVHAQGPDDLFAAFSREDAEAHAAAFNALPCPPGISVSAVVIESPWPAAEHWKYLAEQWKYLADKEQESNSPPAAAHGDDAPGTVRVTADWLKTVHRDLDACQKVIWFAGCRPRVPGGFDPAYCEDAQERLREIDEQIARANGAEGSQHA